MSPGPGRRFRPEAAAAVGQRGGQSTSPEKAETARLNAQRARARDLAALYPFLGRPHWSPPDVVRIGRLFKRLPDMERGRLATLLDHDGIAPYKILAIVEHVSRMPSTERERAYALMSSDNLRDRDLGLTMALNIPPPLDPATPHVQRARDELRAAVRSTWDPALRDRLETAYGCVVDIAKTLLGDAGGGAR